VALRVSSMSNFSYRVNKDDNVDDGIPERGFLVPPALPIFIFIIRGEYMRLEPAEMCL
jgi:hypothetical protein